MDMASDEPPITLGERQALAKIHVQIHVPATNQYFPVQADRVWFHKALRNYGDILLTSLRLNNPGTNLPCPGAWIMQQGNCLVDLKNWDVLAAAKDTVEVLAVDHLSPGTVSRNLVRLFRSNINRPAALEIVMTEDDVIEPPVNCLLLEISMYEKLSGKKKKLKILRNTSILVHQSMTVSKLLDRLDARRVMQVSEAATQDGTSSIREMALGAEDLSFSQIGWRHGMRIQLEAN